MQNKEIDDMTEQELEEYFEKVRDSYMDIVHFNAEQELLGNVMKPVKKEEVQNV